MRAYFKNIDEIIATIKAATIKNKDRKKDFHDAGLPFPPDPVITRWATWIRAVLYYSENLPAVRTVVNNWTSADLLVSRAKDAINVEDLVPDSVKINQYRTLAANVEFCMAFVKNIIDSLLMYSTVAITTRDVEAVIFQTLSLPPTKNEKMTVDNYF